jgi:bifunctional UDP-N-acetylglucosamine pyrophosphorylase/glucosamine-1-phosphate N-acetyltransferase
MSSAKPVVLVLAAGLGTRMKSGRAKVLHPIAGRPLIVWAVEAARGAGAARVVAILGHQLDEVRAELDARYGAGTIGVAHQAEQRGTGHAVRCGLTALTAEPDSSVVVITSGDAPLLRSERISQLIAACAGSPSGMALLSTRPATPIAYGHLVRDAAGKLLRIVEDRDASPEERAIDELNAGFYAIQLGHLRRDVERLDANNAQGELYLTDLAAAAAARGGAAVIEAPFDEVSGINDRVDLAAVEAAARRRINERWMREGVTFVAADQAFVDADAGPIGKDAVIGPGVHLRGKTKIGAGARIECGAVLDDVVVGDGAWLKPYTVAAESTIGERAQVGPFANLRPGTVLEAEVKIGNFVETKKAHFGVGAKASHLSYLGDVSVGARANVGAGVITCNYDGFNKHKTTIEAGAFIGSDSQLIAPVTVGRDAYVGSGTTVTKDVPRSSLALSRTKQVNVDGWADRFREAQGKRRSRTTLGEPKGE